VVRAWWQAWAWRAAEQGRGTVLGSSEGGPVRGQMAQAFQVMARLWFHLGQPELMGGWSDLTVNRVILAVQWTVDCKV
jgi:hypothetical protein